ncbi:ABC transporter substrate-binding protein [Streptomyces glomeratus]|uniref:DNA primase n=1 Tax=Streptomyces glomeratus TaxID=284452 RepID=A0ABP6LZC5_9ACTN|nr:ABC transporter substrate-binding protein [Streptomyces glomeratus]MCF1508867.1 ABC transporter substrate-binding protein [Streptomyces glomeratus]
MNNAKIGAAVLAGYVLGRTKKAKLAMSLGAMLAGSRVKPGQLGKLLQDSPLVGNVGDQVRTELTEAGKTAATTLLSAKAESLADALHERTTGLKERGRGGGGPDEEDREEQEPEGEEPEGEERRGGARRSRESRGAGRERKTQQRGSDQGGEPRGKKAPAARSRSKSGSAGPRRPDDD